VTPTALSYAQPYVGKSYVKSLSITNSGNAALNVTAITVNDTTPGGATITVTHPGLPFVILAGTPQTVTVTVLTTSEATPSGTITIASNDPSTPSLVVPVSATMVDNAALSQCVLIGANIVDGCDHDPGNLTVPQMHLGTINEGQSAAKVVVFWNDGPGNVPVAVSDISFDPAQADPSNYTVQLFQIVNALEVPVSLPFYLSPPDPGDSSPRVELRARVTFRALAAAGPVSGVSLKVTTTHPAGTLSIPISATIGGCPTGFADCDGNPANGCEVNTATDLGNCGGCGMLCGSTNASPTCSAGVCTLNCNTMPYSFANCDGIAANGCETNTTTDVSNCGGCGNVCSTNHATATCGSGACGVVACATGWGNCNSNITDGCETDLTSVSNCGACGINCANYNVANTASTVCNSVPSGTPPWQCGVGICAAGYTDMDKQFSDGCECQEDANATTCGAATDLGTFNVGTSTGIAIAGKITPLSKVEYLRINFAGQATCPAFSPTIQISELTGGVYFDILQSDCSTTPTCGTAESPTLLKVFETNYTSCGAGAESTYTAPASIGTSFVIKVYTTVSSSTTCMPYNLTISN
jgi:hypothetical protein